MHLLSVAETIAVSGAWRGIEDDKALTAAVDSAKAQGCKWY